MSWMLNVEGPCSTETYKSSLRSSCPESWSTSYRPWRSVCVSTSRSSWSLRCGGPGLTAGLTWLRTSPTRLQQPWESVKTTSATTFMVWGPARYVDAGNISQLSHQVYLWSPHSLSGAGSAQSQDPPDSPVCEAIREIRQSKQHFYSSSCYRSACLSCEEDRARNMI